jgi:hypothetical protein
MRHADEHSVYRPLLKSLRDLSGPDTEVSASTRRKRKSLRDHTQPLVRASCTERLNYAWSAPLSCRAYCGSQILISYKHRGDAENVFWEAAEESFEVRLIERDDAPAVSRDGDHLPTLLYRLTRRAAA